MKNIKIIQGIFSQGKGDFGFVDVEGIDKGFFVFGRNKNGALDGDKVEAKVKVFKGKEEAEVIKVLERKTDLVVGKYIPGKSINYGFVIPNNPNIKNDIFVPGKFSKNAKKGDIVGVLIKKWEGKNPEGVIKQIIGKDGDKKIDVLSLIIEGGGKINFPKKVIESLKRFGSTIKKEEYKKRKDLRNLFTFTIDGADAKDLDDAISIEQINLPFTNGVPKGGGIKGYKLYVHIADVAHYVSEQSLLDIEAYKRSTSIYLVDRVIPMLPEKLSNDLCSLNPNTEKLTLTCEMNIGNNGKITKTKVYESIIKSDHRLTYEEVDKIVASFSGQGERIYPQVYPYGQERGSLISQKLQIANTLKEKITRYRQESGVLNFDFPETKIKLDDDGNPISIKEYPRFNSNKMIEEFMISANEAVSRKFSDLPFLYRIHEEPKDDNMIKLQDTLNLFGVNFQFKKGNTKEFSELLKKMQPSSPPKEREFKGEVIEKIVLRTLSKAVYSKENFGHFGLGLSFYSHFTSPIRRYPDLQIHRIIKEKIANKLNNKRLSHYKELLNTVSKYTSEKERKAEKLEYKVKDYYIVQYYKNKIGEEFEGVITGVLPKGFFVALKDTAEGFVELTRTDFIDELQEHKDLKTGKKYRLGDKIKVKLIEADKKLLRLNFEIV